MVTYFVVANQTLPSPLLAREVAKRLAGGPARFHVIVPLMPVRHRWTWEEVESRQATEARLTEFLGLVRGQGGIADGEVGDEDPVLAVRDALRVVQPDEILLSTLPPGRSRWLRLDVQSRIKAWTSIPVTVLSESPTAVPALAR